MDVSNRVAIITGAGRGIGRAAARAFAERGARSVLCDISESCLREAEELRGLGYDAEGILCDVTKRESVAAMVAQVMELYGGIDILVNNAGIIRDSRFSKMSEECWDKVMNVNLKSMFFTCQEVLQHMVARGSGKIVNIASVTGQIGNYGQCNYAASKAGVEGLTRSLCKEYASRGININALAPGLTLSEMTEAIPEEVKEKMLKTIPQGRGAQPEEIAGAILFLASDYASYVNGQTLNVNGGVYM